MTTGYCSVKACKMRPSAPAGAACKWLIDSVMLARFCANLSESEISPIVALAIHEQTSKKESPCEGS